MNWTQLLRTEIESTFATTAKLMEKVDPDSLDWKPESGENWMTVGQLLKHITESCGAACKGFVTGDWGMPEGMNPEDQEFEIARRFVRLAGEAASKAAAAPPSAPSGTVVKQAMKTAAAKHAPGLLKPASGPFAGKGRRRGRWIRRGRKIIVLGA